LCGAAITMSRMAGLRIVAAARRNIFRLATETDAATRRRRWPVDRPPELVYAAPSSRAVYRNAPALRP
jgi:hypothetical protein